jgi:tRNA (uracil-5-)-methyltransferase TRM9
MTLSGISPVFLMADVTSPDWAELLRRFAPFELAVAFALLHHIPGSELRLHILRELHSLLSPGGILIMSNWQFMHNERLRGRIVPWQALAIDEQAVETGDSLLEWKRGGTGYRYVHEFSTHEVESFSEQSGFLVLDQFRADEGLNLFSVLARTK